MKTKICIIITAIIFFTASEVAAVEDKIFTSSGQIVEGEFWSNVYIYNDDTIVDMLGGHLDSIGTYDASTVNVTGGHVNTLDAHEISTANISGGYVYGLSTRDSGTAFLSDMGSVVARSARGSFWTVNMTGGTTEYARAGDSGTLNLYGGVVTDSLNAWDFATVNIFGYDLLRTASGGSYGYGFVTGYWGDGAAFTINLSTSETYSHINLIPVVYANMKIKPETLNLASKGKWISCHIKLPEDHNVADVEPNSIVLEYDANEIEPEWLWFNEKQNVVMARFERSELAEILEPGDVELTVTGHLMDGSYFVGTETIKVIDKGRKD